MREFYRLNHINQAHDFVPARRKQYLGRDRLTMGVGQACECLNQLDGDSEPDTDLSQPTVRPCGHRQPEDDHLPCVQTGRPDVP